MKNKTIKIRQAEESDVDEITQLYSETINNVNAKDYSNHEVEIWSAFSKNSEEWKRRISRQYFLVAELGKMIVGFASIEKNGYLDFMYVHKDHLRMGIARRLLEKIEAKARQQKNEEIFAYVSITANTFFESRGYRYAGSKVITVEDVEFVDRILKKKL